MSRWLTSLGVYPHPTRAESNLGVTTTSLAVPTVARSSATRYPNLVTTTAVFK